MTQPIVLIVFANDKEALCPAQSAHTHERQMENNEEIINIHERIFSNDNACNTDRRAIVSWAPYVSVSILRSVSLTRVASNWFPLTFEKER